MGLGSLVQGGLGGRVGVCLQAGDAHAIDRADLASGLLLLVRTTGIGRTLMILPTPSRLLPFSSIGTNFCVRVNTRCTLSVNSFVNAESGYVAKVSPHVTPELFTCCQMLRWEPSREGKASPAWQQALCSRSPEYAALRVSVRLVPVLLMYLTATHLSPASAAPRLISRTRRACSNRRVWQNIAPDPTPSTASQSLRMPERSGSICTPDRQRARHGFLETAHLGTVRDVARGNLVLDETGVNGRTIDGPSRPRRGHRQ